MKLDRFRMLEGQRPLADEPKPAPAPNVSERFAAVAPAEPAPPPELGLELDPRDLRPERALIRCVECAHDNHAYVDVCAKCSATLKTRAVHHLNLRLQQDERAAAFGATVTAHTGEATGDETTEKRTILDRAADRIPTSWPLRVRRAIVVAGVAAMLSLIYLATGWGVVGFLIALVVTLGVCLVPT